ncbi:MAG: transposase, partial [Thermodesulfobacteriota bacterium]|nr:transposase [Thermodesulfobacteriota bacterium]
ILRRYFLYDRKLLTGLSRCGWEALKAFYATGVGDSKAVSGAVLAIQTFGDFLGFHPHLHILVSDGCFHKNGMFSASSTVNTNALERIFRYKVLKMLLSKSKIKQNMIALLDKWRHTGFNVFAGPRILPRNETSMENLARYIIRASFSQERMTYHRETSQVEYQSKDGSQTKVFDALEWLAAMPACACRTQTGAATCPIKANRWSDTMAIIVTRRGENGKKLLPMIRSPASLSRSWPARLFEKPGRA